MPYNLGDVINIHDKQPDGWWLGELNGVVGIFPATYVEEISWFIVFTEIRDETIAQQSTS